MYENEKYDVEWTYPYMDNYTGPNWSNGKWQSSVANGDKKPKSRSDSYSRDHDTSYKLCDDDRCLDDADWLYYERFQTFDDFIPKYLIGPAPLVYNIPSRAISRFFSGEKYSKMAAQATPYRFRGSGNDNKVDDTKNYVAGAAKPSLRGGVYDPDFQSCLDTSIVYNPTPEVQANTTQYSGGNPRGLRRSNFFFRSRHNNPLGYIGFGKFKNKKNRVYLEW